MNELCEFEETDLPHRWFIHGVSYIDERLMMMDCQTTSTTSDDRPYYYVLDRMYSVRYLGDRAGAIVERYCYDE